MWGYKTLKGHWGISVHPAQSLGATLGGNSTMGILEHSSPLPSEFHTFLGFDGGGGGERIGLEQ